MDKSRVLIIEDIASISSVYAAHLERAGYATTIADTIESGRAALAEHGSAISAILLDIQLPDMNGLEFLRSQPELVQRVPIIVATADASIARAIEAMRLGAFDFLVKPLSSQRLIKTIESATSISSSLRDRVPVTSKSNQARGFMGFIGISPPMQNVYRQIERVAHSRATVFISGESGTGKEVCAESIHKAGPRADRPFVAINCAAIPENLLESELFGHLKGTFTGAVSDRIGAAQAANGGSLFLDEICEMPLHLQVKLLRFLQTSTIQRVGATRTEDVDIRIICATNRIPAAEVAAGRFREDLFYRLSVIPIELPPLRARGHDIALLANAFLKRFGADEGKTFNALSTDFTRALGQHSWPGNVRELQNLIRRAAVIYDGPNLEIDALPRIAETRTPSGGAPILVQETNVAASSPPEVDEVMIAASIRGLTLDELERIAVESAIAAHGGNLTTAAKALGVSPSTLYRKRDRWAA
jgi:two-component system repressor protein LuxO